MAKIQIPKSIPPSTISNFLGINESSDGSTELQLGEASKMINWRITDGGKLKKMEGYSPLFPSLGSGTIQGQWQGDVNGSWVHLFAHGGNIYKRPGYTIAELEAMTLAEIEALTLSEVGGYHYKIGTMTDAKTSFFYFSGKVYIINGYEYKSWDGTTFADVVGYRPKIVIGTPPGGGVGSTPGDGMGRLFEEINNLTGAKHQTFSPNTTLTGYQLAETNIDSVDFVKILGVTKTVTTDYTVNLVTGVVTFTVAPPTGTPDIVDIGWTKGIGDRPIVLNNLFVRFYGGTNDNRVLMFGNALAKNRFIFSGLANGVPSAEYFPANNYGDAGSSEFAITDLIRQYDRLIIPTEQGSYYTNYETTTLVDGTVVVSFPIYTLNSTKGNVAMGQGQLVNNNPFTIQEGVYQWTSTNVRDERNATYMSKRVQPSLDLVDLTKAVTFDYEKNGEYWLVVGSTAWIYNYRVDVWYQRSNVTASNFIEIDGELYFGTDGTIIKFDPLVLTDNGVAISAVWEMGFFDFGAEYLNKYLNNIWISLKPEIKSSVDVQTETNNDGLGEVEKIYYNLYTFKTMDFRNFSFHTSSNPQPFYLEVQAMGFCFFKLILSNSSEDEATILSINLPARLGGKVR